MEMYKYIQPSVLLAPYIKHHWIMELDERMTDPVRVTTSGFMQLVFHRADRMHSITENETQPQAFISGHTTVYMDIIPTGKLSMIVTVLRPQGAKAFFDMPMSEFHEKIVPVEYLDKHSMRDLEDKVRNAPDNDMAVRIIEDHLIKKLYSFDDYNYRRILATVRRIEQDEKSNLLSLSEVSCLSKRQFNRVFTDYVGTSPKEFIRIIRYQRALHSMESKPHISLTELAYECGYYDQPHMIKEFKTFSGYTPNEFRAIRTPHSDYFSNF